MPKREKIAYKELWRFLTSDMESQAYKYVRSFINDYINGLHKLDKLEDKGFRIDMMILLTDNYLVRARLFCRHKLPEFQYDNLLNTIKTFHREFVRKNLGV